MIAKRSTKHNGRHASEPSFGGRPDALAKHKDRRRLWMGLGACAAVIAGLLGAAKATGELDNIPVGHEVSATDSPLATDTTPYPYGDGETWEEDSEQLELARKAHQQRLADEAEEARLAAEEQAYMDQAPPLLNPNAYQHGDFIGAVQVSYQSPRTSPLVREGDGLYREYFNGNYSPPQNEQVTFGLHAIFDMQKSEQDRLLERGPILDTITAPNALVMGLHNVSEISSSVYVNGQTINETHGGANGVLEVGDTVSLLLQDPSRADVIMRYTYELRSQDDMQVVPYNAATIDSYVYAQPVGDEPQLLVYWCWPPGSESNRLLLRLTLVDTAKEYGVVAASADAASPASIEVGGDFALAG